jgi:hypothetical protein
MAVRQLSDGNDEGQVLGQSSTDKIAFYGDTPVVQASAIASPLSTLPSLKSKVISILTALRNLGLINT